MYRFGMLIESISSVSPVLCGSSSNTAVLMSPETAVARPWKELFREPYFKANLALVAVDEAHCIQEWSVFIMDMRACTLSLLYFVLLYLEELPSAQPLLRLGI